jgi:hypothetical protein
VTAQQILDLRDLLRREVSRSARHILTFKDREVDGRVPPAVATELRQRVLDALNRLAHIAEIAAQAALDELVSDDEVHDGAA